MTTHVVDYGLGNLMSVAQGLEAVGSDPVVTSEPEEILKADRLILPGVGAFGVAIKSLESSGIGSALINSAQAGVPILGICLGMQLLFDGSSEFGFTPGLGLIPGEVAPIVVAPRPGELRSTHIGWRKLDWSLTSNPLVSKSVDPSDSFYFVHSYAATPSRGSDVWASVGYGEHRVTAFVGSGKIWGSQFHPEKSGAAGLKVLKAFVNA
tara:strand:+ start:175 stop:801 length:627 start_codon:yes stop_codon:yes gene_type:complete